MINIITHNESSLFHSETHPDLELNFNFNLEDSFSEEYSKDELYYDSFDNPEDLENSNLNYTQDFINIDIEEDYFKSSMSLRRDIVKYNLPQSYVYIDIPHQNIKKKFNMSKSVIQYLSSSVNFLKESYKYFSNYNSI